MEVQSKIEQALIEIDGNKTLSEESMKEYMMLFEQYECWTPYLKLFEKKSKKLDDYIRLARIQNIYLEDIQAASVVCIELIKTHEVDFTKFQIEIIPKIIELDDYPSEAIILSLVANAFLHREDVISCLERLAMIYEKKTYNDKSLAETFQKLIEFDPTNLKALRYFKMVYTQEQDWLSVAKLLKDILKNVHHKQEKFRVAQELATVYLYQLGLAKDAIENINQYCSDSPLDTTKIKLDAYTQLQDWASCIKVLDHSLSLEPDPLVKSVLHYKMAELYLKTGDFNKAKQSYEKSAILCPDLYEPIEKLIDLALSKPEWPEVLKWLKELSNRVNQVNLQDNISQAINRIENALGKEH